jgi:excisionase family DNA binding protein
MTSDAHKAPRTPQDAREAVEGTNVPTRLYLTVSEACAALGVSRNTLERGVRSGTVPSVRPGGPTGAIRIPRVWVERGWEEHGDEEAVGGREPVPTDERSTLGRQRVRRARRSAVRDGEGQGGGGTAAPGTGEVRTFPKAKRPGDGGLPRTVAS